MTDALSREQIELLRSLPRRFHMGYETHRLLVHDYNLALVNWMKVSNTGEPPEYVTTRAGSLLLATLDRVNTCHTAPAAEGLSADPFTLTIAECALFNYAGTTDAEFGRLIRKRVAAEIAAGLPSSAPATTQKTTPTGDTND